MLNSSKPLLMSIDRRDIGRLQGIEAGVLLLKEFETRPWSSRSAYADCLSMRAANDFPRHATCMPGIILIRDP